MIQLVIDKKKYVLLPEKDFLLLQKKAALKSLNKKSLSVEEARKHSKALIRKWASEK